MTCIYTGAHVFVADFGFSAAADIFEVSGALIIRFSGDPTKDQRNFSVAQDARITHIAHLDYVLDRDLWERIDLGVIVIDKRHVQMGLAHRDYKTNNEMADDRAALLKSRNADNTDHLA